MALNKSKNWWALGLHCLVYSLCFSFWGPTFVIATFCTHFLTDAITSRGTSYLWFVRVIEPLNGPGSKFYGAFENSKRHWFFVLIGFDQLIHFTTLGITLKLIG